MVTRLEAIQKNLPRFMGNPCKRGHSGIRYVKSYHCVECDKLRTKNNQIRKNKTLENLKKWNKENPDKVLERVKKYQGLHPEIRAAVERRRRARKLNQLCNCCTNAEITAIYYEAAQTKSHVDHIIPLALGGLHCIHNLQILSKEMHMLKTRKDLSIINTVPRVPS